MAELALCTERLRRRRRIGDPDEAVRPKPLEPFGESHDERMLGQIRVPAFDVRMAEVGVRGAWINVGINELLACVASTLTYP